MASEARLLTLEFLRWVAARPRRAAEAREAWRSTCPLTCAWEDAISDGLVRFDGPASGRDALLVLTPRGEALLQPAISLDPGGARS